MAAKMKDYVVEVVYVSKHGEVEQELFEVSATNKAAAHDCVAKMLTYEGAKITYIKCNLA